MCTGVRCCLQIAGTCVKVVSCCRQYGRPAIVRDDDIMTSMHSRTTGPPMNSSDYLQVYPGNVTTDAGDEGRGAALLPIEFVVVLVLAAACIIVGVVYAYVHVTRASRARVEKHKRRPSSFGHHHVNSVDEGSRQKTHLMFFKKTASV